MNLLFGKLRPSVALSSIACSVNNHIGFVLFRGFPRQVIGGNAGKVAVAAGVCSFMIRRRGRAFHKLADVAGGNAQLAVDNEFAAPFAAYLRKRPYQALLASVVQCNFLNEPHRFTSNSSASERISMSLKSLIVCAAQPFRFVALATIFDRAYHEISHLSLQLGSWLERGSSVDALAALADSTRKNSDLPLFGQNL